MDIDPASEIEKKYKAKITIYAAKMPILPGLINGCIYSTNYLF